MLANSSAAGKHLSLPVRGKKNTVSHTQSKQARGEGRQRKRGRDRVCEKHHGGTKGEMSGKAGMEKARLNTASQGRWKQKERQKEGLESPCSHLRERKQRKGRWKNKVIKDKAGGLDSEKKNKFAWMNKAEAGGRRRRVFRLLYWKPGL